MTAVVFTAHFGADSHKNLGDVKNSRLNSGLLEMLTPPNSSRTAQSKPDAYRWLRLLTILVLAFASYGWWYALSSSTSASVLSAPERRTLAACAQALACGVNRRGTGPIAGPAPCGHWNLTLVRTPEAVVELPLLVWSQLHVAAMSALYFQRGCRGSIFPVYTTNAQFADSTLMAPTEMQAIYGFRMLPFIAYTQLVVTQVSCLSRGTKPR